MQNGGEIVRHANGVSQTTDFGSAAVVVDGERTEQFLTVTRRQGKRTWRWQLDTSLAPRVGNDGAVVFLNDSSRRVAGPVLAPVQILDARGRNVTPEGARWSTGLNRKGWELRLTIDDSELPLPYVIDPAVVHDATTVSNNGAGGAATISLTYPAGVSQYDLLVATIAVRGGVAVTTPGGWAAGRSSQNGANVRLATFYKVATAGEPASQSFTLAGSQQAVGAISAYYGIKASLGNANILDVMGAAAPATPPPPSASSITTTTANALLVASFGTNNNDTFGAVTGMTERWDATSASATPANRASGAQSDSTQVAAGATGAKTSALAGNRQWAAHLHSFEVDNVNPSLTETIGEVARGTLNLTSTVSDADSGIATVLYEGSPAGAGTWTTIGTTTTAPYSLTFDTTVAPDGLYDVRVTATDWAGNTTTVTGMVRVDNSSPDQNPLTLTPLTGTANQYWDSTNSVLYYNPTSAGTFSLSSVPRDVSPPISFVGGNGGANNNSPLTLNVPAGVQLGDLLIAQVGYERTMAISVPTPAGWTRHVDRDNGTIYGQVIFYRWATASEPASYTIPHASGAASISGTLLAYRGVASVSPVLVNNGTVATGTTLTAPSVTTPVGCGRLVAFYGLWNTATLTTPTGMTQRATAINTEVDWNSRVLAADEILGAAGATGTRVSTATVTDANSTGPGSNVSELVALRPLACVSSVQYPTPGQTGFTGGGNTDTVEPYAASPDYSFGPTNTVSPGARTIVVSDEAGNPALNQTITFTRDVAAPVTTDDTGTITNAWRNVDTTVTLSPSDGAGAGLVQTYYTTNGVNPTTGSPTGTSILLTAEGTYTIKYFSTDRVANTEAVKTGVAQIRIDKTNPTSATLNALPAAIRNGQSLTGGGADALSGVGSITYLYCAGAACTPSTVVGSSSTPAGGYPVTWNGQPADGTYRVRARVFDAAGNQLDSAIQTVTIDNTNPTGAVTAPAAAANVRGTSVAVTSNSADGGSGVANALFQRSPAGAGTWTTIGAADTSTPYGVTWDTTAVTDGLYDLRVVTTDNAGNTFTSPTITNVRVDNTNPTGAVTAPAAAANVRGTSVAVTSNSADGGSGVANALFQRSPAGAGTWTTIGAADTSTPYGVTWDTTAVTDGLYDLRVVTTDNAGNTFTSPTITNVRVDNTVPTQSLALTGVAPAGSRVPERHEPLLPRVGGRAAADPEHGRRRRLRACFLDDQRARRHVDRLDAHGRDGLDARRRPVRLEPLLLGRRHDELPHGRPQRHRCGREQLGDRDAHAAQRHDGADRRRADRERRRRVRGRDDEQLERQLHDRRPHRLDGDGDPDRLRPRVVDADARLGLVQQQRLRLVQRQPDDDRRRARPEPHRRLLPLRPDRHGQRGQRRLDPDGRARPRGGNAGRAQRRDHEPGLRGDAGADRDDPGRRRQHRHLRQHHRRQLHQGLRRRHRHRHRHRDRHGRRRDQDDHRSARRTRRHASRRDRAHHRHPRLLHRRPRRRNPDRAHRRNHQPHLRGDAGADRDDPGRRREHRHRRQHHRRHLRQAVRRRHRHRHRHRDRRERRRDQDDHRRARRARRHGGHRRRAHHRHPRLLHRRPRRRRPDRAHRRDHEPDLGCDARADRDDPGRGREHGHLATTPPSSPSPSSPAPAPSPGPAPPRPPPVSRPGPSPARSSARS